MTGADVRRLRADLALTAKQFSEILGVHPSTVHRWEVARNDGRNLRIEPLQLRLLQLLGQEHAKRSADERAALTALLDYELGMGGGLRAIHALLRVVFAA
jgi:hypothetical protein